MEINAAEDFLLSLDDTVLTDEYIAANRGHLLAALEIPEAERQDYTVRQVRRATLERRRRERELLLEKRKRETAERAAVIETKRRVAAEIAADEASAKLRIMEIKVLLSDAVTASLTTGALNIDGVVVEDFVDMEFTRVDEAVVRRLYQAWVAQNVRFPRETAREKPAYHTYVRRLLRFLRKALGERTLWRVEWEERVFMCAGKLRKEPDFMIVPYYERYPAASSLCGMGEVKPRWRATATMEQLMDMAAADAYHYSLASLRQRVEMIHDVPGLLRSLGIATNAESIQFMFATIDAPNHMKPRRHLRRSPWLPLLSAAPAAEPTAGFTALVRLLCTPPEQLYGASPLAQSVQFNGTTVRLHQCVGRGASADVYSAAWPIAPGAAAGGGAGARTGEAAAAPTYAVKRLRHVDTIYAARFGHEATALTELAGVPGVPELIYAHTPATPDASDTPYLVMWPLGEPLAHFLYGVPEEVDEEDEEDEEEADAAPGAGAGAAPQAGAVAAGVAGAAGGVADDDDEWPAVVAATVALAASHLPAPAQLIERADRVAVSLEETLGRVAGLGWAQLDLRPSNVVWAGDRALLVDWGSAERLEQRALARGVVLFMADACEARELEESHAGKPYGEGRVRITPALDREALAYTYAAMLHGGRAMGAPWALMTPGPESTVQGLRRAWYAEHRAKLPDCPCLARFLACTGRPAGVLAAT